jgi:hypothetical protein
MPPLSDIQAGHAVACLKYSHFHRGNQKEGKIQIRSRNPARATRSLAVVPLLDKGIAGGRVGAVVHGLNQSRIFGSFLFIDVPLGSQRLPVFELGTNRSGLITFGVSFFL